MRTSLLTSTLLVAIGLTGSGESAFAQRKDPTPKEPAKAEQVPVVPKSEFQEPLKPPFTDPFYPKSQRMPYLSSKAPAPEQNTGSVLLDQIALKGFSRAANGTRLALINNNTFAAGESGTIKLPKGTARIEVLEVKERSAIIKIENDPKPKEIILRPEP